MEAPRQLPGNQPTLGLGPQHRDEGHSLGEWRHLVSYQVIDIKSSNAAWAKAPGQLPGHHHKP